MARPLKKGADYFRHDASASEDPKLMHIEGIFGLEGYALYFKMIEVLCQQTEKPFKFKWRDEAIFILMRKLNFRGEQERLIKFFDTCMDSSYQAPLFKIDEDGYLYSPGLLKRMESLVETRKRNRERKSGKTGGREGKGDRPAGSKPITLPDVLEQMVEEHHAVLNSPVNSENTHSIRAFLHGIDNPEQYIEEFNAYAQLIQLGRWTAPYGFSSWKKKWSGYEFKRILDEYIASTNSSNKSKLEERGSRHNDRLKTFKPLGS